MNVPHLLKTITLNLEFFELFDPSGLGGFISSLGLKILEAF